MLGFTHALRVQFTDETSLNSYATHPEHVAWKKQLKLSPQTPNIMCLDWHV